MNRFMLNLRSLDAAHHPNTHPSSLSTPHFPLPNEMDLDSRDHSSDFIGNIGEDLVHCEEDVADVAEDVIGNRSHGDVEVLL